MVSQQSRISNKKFAIKRITLTKTPVHQRPTQKKIKLRSHTTTITKDPQRPSHSSPIIPKTHYNPTTPRTAEKKKIPPLINAPVDFSFITHTHSHLHTQTGRMRRAHDAAAEKGLTGERSGNNGRTISRKIRSACVRPSRRNWTRGEKPILLIKQMRYVRLSNNRLPSPGRAAPGFDRVKLRSLGIVFYPPRGRLSLKRAR